MRRALAFLALAVMLVGCSGGAGTVDTTTAPSPTSSPATTQATAGGVLDANTGNSDKVPGPLNGRTTVADMRRLLRAAQVEPPYVLLGASFGGLLAYMYAVTCPKEVKACLAA